MSHDTATCAATRARLSERSPDTLISEHLQACQPCRHFAATLDRVLAVAPTTGPAAPADLHERLHATLSAVDTAPQPARERRPTGAPSWHGWIGRVAAAVAAAAVAVVAVQMARPEPPAAALAAAVREAGTTPVTFSFSGTMRVAPDPTAVEPSGSRGQVTGSRPVATAMPALLATGPSLEVPPPPGPPDPPEVPFEAPDATVEPFEFDVTVPPVDPMLPEISVEAPAWLREDLARFGVEWEPAQATVDVRYHGRGHSDGRGRLAYDLTLQTRTGVSERLDVVTSEGHTWVRTEHAGRWARTDQTIELRIGPLTVPHTFTRLLAEIEQAAATARPIPDSPDHQSRGYTVTADHGRIETWIGADGTTMEQLRWSGAATLHGNLRVSAQVELRVEGASDTQVEIPRTSVWMNDLPADQRPSLISTDR